MPLPVLSLFSMASREVLTLHLDTRDLPRHLHKQLEDYRRLEGAFTLREVVMEVQRIDRGKVNEEDREEAWQFYLDSGMGQIMKRVFRRPTENSWAFGWAGGQGSTTVQLENPVDILHGNIVRKYELKNQHFVNSHRATYLDNGKIFIVARVEEKMREITLVTEDTITFELDKRDSLTMVQRLESAIPGMALILTTRAPRATSLEGRVVFFDYDKEWHKRCRTSC